MPKQFEMVEYYEPAVVGVDVDFVDNDDDGYGDDDDRDSDLN